MNRREMLASASLPLIGQLGVDGPLWADPTPYDPVAVLEAMRERGFCYEISTGDESGWMLAFSESLFHSSVQTAVAQDFPSAVRWLHGQAAAADAEFAAAYPLPTE